VLQLVRAGAHEGQYVHVRGLAADDRFVYAPYFLSPINPARLPANAIPSPEDNATATAAPGFLAVIDAATWTVKHRIQVGDQPVGVACHNNAQRRRLFVVNRGPQSTNLSVIDLAVDGKSFNSLPPVPLHAGIWDVAVHQASNRAYVTRWAGTLYVIDALATDPAKLLVESISTGLGILSMSVDQAANRIYLVRSVQDPTLGFVERIELFDPVQKTFTPLGVPDFPARSQPFDLAFDPDGRLYISNLGNTPAGAVPPNVTVVDLTADDATPVRTTSGPWTVAVDPERNQVYAPTREGVELIARSNHGGDLYSVMLRVGMGPFPASVAVHPVSGEVYVGDFQDGSVRAAPPVDASEVVAWH
jgi:DNA-binding beta-propeller fold protein YncE